MREHSASFKFINLSDNSKIIAFDYGLKRIGVAVSNSELSIALPLTTIDKQEGLPFLKKYLSQNKVSTLVLGFPVTLKGLDCAIVEDIKKFRELVENSFPTLKVEYIDERFTSKLASQIIAKSGLPKKKRQDKKRIDIISATIILQCWISKHSINKL